MSSPEPRPEKQRRQRRAAPPVRRRRARAARRPETRRNHTQRRAVSPSSRPPSPHRGPRAAVTLTALAGRQRGRASRSQSSYSLWASPPRSAIARRELELDRREQRLALGQQRGEPARLGEPRRRAAPRSAGAQRRGPRAAARRGAPGRPQARAQQHSRAPATTRAKREWRSRASRARVICCSRSAAAANSEREDDCWVASDCRLDLRGVAADGLGPGGLRGGPSRSNDMETNEPALEPVLKLQRSTSCACTSKVK